MPERTRKINALKSVVRSKIEHVFALQKGPMDVFIRLVPTKIGMINLAST